MIFIKNEILAVGLVGLALVGCTKVNFSGAAPSSTTKDLSCVSNCVTPMPKPVLVPVPVTQTYQVPNSVGKMDILLVVDSTPTMFLTLSQMASRLKGFISSLGGADYQVAVLNAALDNYDATLGYLTAGQLMALDTVTVDVTNPLYILNSNVAPYGDLLLDQNLNFNGVGWAPDAPVNFCTLQPYCTTGPAEPMGAILTMINNRLAAANSGFFRAGANLVPIIFTANDENDGKPFVQPTDVINGYNQSLASTMAGMHVFNFIVKPGDSACLNQYSSDFQMGSDGGYGTTLDALAQASDGASYSICDANYTADLAPLAQGFGPKITTITLEHTPVAGTLKITSSASQNLQFSVDGPIVDFTQPLLAGSTLTISYTYDASEP